jgi:hypothetical protein
MRISANWIMNNKHHFTLLGTEIIKFQVVPVNLFYRTFQIFKATVQRKEIRPKLGSFDRHLLKRKPRRF